MRKVVVDSNYLRRPELRSYLAASKENIAVLTDYASMEAYKGDTLASIYNSMAVLADFPSQVLVLKNTSRSCGLSGRTAGLQRRLIDSVQTKGFGIYCKSLAAAKAGDVALQGQLIDAGREASMHLEERMLADARKFPAVIGHAAAMHSREELAGLRSDAPYSDETIKNLVKVVLLTAKEMYAGHPRVQTPPSWQEMPNTFIFRAALSAYLLALDWVAVAGANGAKGAQASKLRNDMVDVNFVTYATYFDDLLSGDTKAQRIYDRARLFLSRVFGCQISGLES